MQPFLEIKVIKEFFMDFSKNFIQLTQSQGGREVDRENQEDE